MLKKLTLVALTLCFQISIFGFQDIFLKFTNKGEPVVRHDVEVRNGDAIIGYGKTNWKGEVKIHANLLSKKVDLFGKTMQDSIKRTWQLVDYIVLDESFSAHVEMEKYTKLIANESNGLVTEYAVAKSWGLTERGISQGVVNLDSGGESAPPKKLTLEEEKGYASDDDDYQVVYGSTETYRDQIEKQKTDEKDAPDRYGKQKEESEFKKEVKEVSESLEKVSLKQKIKVQEVKLDKKRESLDRKRGGYSSSQIEIKEAEIKVLELKIQENYAKLEKMK